jgi:protein gp37
MGERTGIAWCDHTFNPWWGCTKVSAGCANCYAERVASRFGHDVWGPLSPRRVFTERHWNDPLRWDRAAVSAGVRRRVFCGSMCDVFESNPVLVSQRARLFGMFGLTPNLDWLLLTKRPDFLGVLLPPHWEWPRNVWLGVSIEDHAARVRLAYLTRIPAAVRFVSAEPLLEYVDLSGYLDRVDWVIIGGESQLGARPMPLEGALRMAEDCRRAGVPVFVKQLGGHPDKRDRPDKWPAALRIQQFPQEVRVD